MKNVLLLIWLIASNLLLMACSTQAPMSPSMSDARLIRPPDEQDAPANSGKSHCDTETTECSSVPVDPQLSISYLAMVNCDFVADHNNCGASNPRGSPPQFQIQEPICIFWQESGNPTNTGIHIVVNRAGSLTLTKDSEAFGMNACRSLQLSDLPPGKYLTTIESGNQRWPVDWSIADDPPLVDAGLDRTVHRNEMITVTGRWTDPAGSYDNDYKWAWDLKGDGNFNESGTAAYGEEIVYTAAFANEGTFKLSFQVADNTGVSEDSILITVINHLPYAIDLPLATNEKTAVDFVLPAGDDDGDQLSFKVVNGPSYGVLAGTPPNLRYVPNEVYIGSDSFTFVVNDGLVDSENVGTVKIVINPLNRLPEAGPDPYETYEDSAVTIPVLNNDNPGAGDQNQSLTIKAVSDPPYGWASVNQDGTITYYPDADFYGQDGFTYDVCDSDGCAIGIVTVQVTPVNDPPRPMDDPITVDENSMVTFPVLGNDNAGPENEYQSLTPTGVSDPPYGWATLNQDGTITYYPDKDFSGQDNFIYNVCDSEMNCSTGNVTVQIYALSDAPSPVDDYVTTPPNRAIQIDVSANDFDADYNLDRSSTYAVSNPSAGYLTYLGNGWFEYAPVQDYVGSDSWVYSICDTDKTCVTATVYVTVAQ